MAEPILEFFYQIFVGGLELSEFQYSMVDSVVLNEVSSGADILTISLEDPDFIFLEDRFFVEDYPIKALLGYKDNYVTFDGYISVIDVEFPESGSATVVLNCMDKSHVMNRTKKKRTWANLRHSDIASKIFAEYGLKAVVEATTNVEESVAQNDYDIKFLESLAEDQATKYAVWVEGTTGYFVTKKITATPQADLDYRAGKMNVNSFSPRINKETLPNEVTTSNVNIYDQKVDTATTSSATPRPVSGNDDWEDNRVTPATTSSKGYVPIRREVE